MKNIKHTQHNTPLYPGAANKNYFINKAVNTVTAVASGMGFLAVVLFIFLL